MGTVSMYDMTFDDLENYATQVKNVFVRFLVKEEIITEEQATDLELHTVLLHKKPNLISTMYNKLVGKKLAENPHIIVARLHSILNLIDKSTDEVSDPIDDESCK